jgi:tungstate transport system substrate-binding protein
MRRRHSGSATGGWRRHLVPLIALGFALAASQAIAAGPRAIKLASTTSTDNSGLFGHLLPIFEAETGIKVHVIAVGTGQARFDVMYNDFVIVGPADDPAGVRGLADATAALRRIAVSNTVFASRGDDSGTHRKEQALWREAGVDVAAASGGWYRETGSGMGATLNTASGLDAYALTDRATWISFKNKGELRVLVEGDKRLFNQYGVIRVSSAVHPHVRAREAQIFIDWLLSPAGQGAIAAYRLDGKQLFFANATGSDS